MVAREIYLLQLMQKNLL